jgi:hypothetical protein
MSLLRAALYWIACLLAAVTVGLLLGGCAPYWVRDFAPVEVRGVIRLADVSIGCRDHVWGCFDRATGMEYIRTGLPRGAEACVASHEARHAAGYSHDARAGFAVDCGDGTIWMPSYD